MQILVSIVNFRTPQLVINCLESLATDLDHQAGDRVVVADANSGDGSPAIIRQAIDTRGYGSWVELLALPDNPGFAASNNRVIERSKQEESREPWDAVWLLNPDTVVLPGARDALVSELLAADDVGIVGSRLQGRDNSPQFASFRFHTAASEFDLHFRWGVVSQWLQRSVVVDPRIDESHETQWVSGASMLLRREVLNQIGLLDEGYFLYFEETDFCLRARGAQWKCRYSAESRVIHIGGQATGVHEAETRRRPRYWFQSRRRYFVKNHGLFYAALVDTLAISGLICWNMRRVVQRKPRQDPPRFLSDLIRNSVFLTGFSP